MEHVLSIIRERSPGLQYLPCERVSLDFDRFNEYQDSHEHRAERPFERPPVERGKKLVRELGARVPTILRYFLDGSRRTYKVADVILDGRYLPLIAGQVGVAVVERPDGGAGVIPLRRFSRFLNVMAFPDRIGEADLSELEAEINRRHQIPFHLLRYTVKPDRDPTDLGVARILSEMHDIELQAVREMAEEQMLRNDRLLVIDGPLRFKKKLDIVQFRNVVGLSKSFRPSFTLGKGRAKRDVGSITSGLRFAERTSVFRTMERDKVIGMWYLRLRPRPRMANPLQGVVKMECYAIDPEDIEDGFASDRIDTISSFILAERNVTPFGVDSRWASHIYPVYLAEAYLKSGFMADTHFKGLF